MFQLFFKPVDTLIKALYKHVKSLKCLYSHTVYFRSNTVEFAKVKSDHRTIKYVLHLYYLVATSTILGNLSVLCPCLDVSCACLCATHPRFHSISAENRFYFSVFWFNSSPPPNGILCFVVVNPGSYRELTVIKIGKGSRYQIAANNEGSRSLFMVL